jgi:hypothetical protein
MKTFLIILCVLVSSPALADEYLGKLSKNRYDPDSTSNEYGEGLSIQGDDDN